MDAEHFSDENDDANPPIEGSLRKSDCGQVTDGAAALFLASREVAESYARRTGKALEDIPRIKGWGHTTAPMLYETKMRESRGAPYIFPHVRTAMSGALKRAGVKAVYEVDGLEVHDCFSGTEYLSLEPC